MNKTNLKLWINRKCLHSVKPWMTLAFNLPIHKNTYKVTFVEVVLIQNLWSTPLVFLCQWKQRECQTTQNKNQTHSSTTLPERLWQASKIEVEKSKRQLLDPQFTLQDLHLWHITMWAMEENLWIDQTIHHSAIKQIRMAKGLCRVRISLPRKQTHKD